jgi:hypothetical protein
MKFKYLNMFIGLCLALGIGIRFVNLGSASVNKINAPLWPQVHNKTPNEADIKVIQLVLEKSYTINSDGNTKEDASRYVEVYTNDVNVPLNTQQQEFVQRVRTTHNIHERMMEQEGWLSFKMAQFIDLTNGRRGLAAKQAIKPGQELTAEDTMSIPAVNVPNPITLDKLPSVTELVYKEINVDENTAWVRYDDGSAEAEAFLVRIDGTWKIAGIRPINIHF